MRIPAVRTFDTPPVRTARSLALDVIRQKIIRLELAPGARLSENELASQLGFSRTPVRESLIVLTEERLVSVVPQVGTLVAPISEKEIATAQFVRESLELAALRESASRVTPEQIADLNALIVRQRGAQLRQDSEEFFALDEDFHFTLMSISGHGSAWRTVGQAKAHLDRARRLTLTLTTQFTTLIEQHQAVIDALAIGAIDDATSALRAHLRRVFEDIAFIRTTSPELFSENSLAARRR
jgi:DNA-binding GntR family transcriptional regulator